MAYRIDINARYRFDEKGDTATPIPPDQSDTFRRQIDLIVDGQGGNRGGKDQQAHSGDRAFVVEAGDTLEDIARENYADPAEAIEINGNAGNDDGDLIHPGDVVILSAPEPERVAESAADATGEPSGEDVFIDSLYQRGNQAEYAEPSEHVDIAGETERMKQDVADYLAALPQNERQDAALRLSGADWIDAGPAGAAVSEAVEAAGLESDPVEVFADQLYERGNALEYADASVPVDHGRDIAGLADDIGGFLQSLPQADRAKALQNLYDRDWRDAGPAEMAIEQAATAANIDLKPTGHNGPDMEARIRAIVDGARASSSDPQTQFETFAESCNNADPQLRQALMRTGYADDFIASMADYATEPLKDFDPGNGDNQSKPYLTFLRLDGMTEHAPPELAAALVWLTMPALEKANIAQMDVTGSPMLAYGGVETMLKVADRIEDTPLGDSIIERWADIGFYAPNQLTRAIADGGSLRYPLELSERNGDSTLLLDQDILPGIRESQGNVNAAVDDYAKHMEELRWLIDNHGDAMTPDALEQAIADYKTEKGADWEKLEKELEGKVADQGEILLNQLTQLGNFPTEPAVQKDRINQEIDNILGDDRSYLAIQTALRSKPELLDSPQMLTFVSQQARLTDRGRKLAEEVFTQFVQRDVLPKFSDFKPGDPDSMRDIRNTLAKFRDSKFSTLIGVTEKDMNKAIDAIQNALPTATDTPDSIALKMKTLDQELGKLDGNKLSGIRSFSNSSVPGQVLRMIGATASAVGLYNSAERAGTDPNLENILKVTYDSVGMWQRSVEIRKGFDLIDPDSFAARHFDSSLKGGTKLLGAVGAVFDGINSVQAFADGDPLMGGVNAGIAAGGLTATFGAGTIAGPIGIGVVILGVGASMIISDVRERNKYDTDISAHFLAHSGLSDEAADALVDQSGDGNSPVPILLEYAKDKGFDLENPAHLQAFVDWVNGMSPDQLATLRDNLHHTIDDFGGDATKLEQTASDDDAYTDKSAYERYIVTRGGAVVGEEARVEDGDASPSSVTQIDIALASLGITELAIPTS